MIASWWSAHALEFVGWGRMERVAQEEAVVAWLAAKAARPPEEADMSKYSNEIEPELPLELLWWAE